MTANVRLALFAGFLVIATALAINSIETLPDRVAVHFGQGGIADGWVTRGEYRLLALISLLGLPLFLVWVMAGLPRIINGRGQIPNCEYWFADERRRATEDFLIRHSLWLGFMTIAIVYGIHLSIVRANGASPPVLAEDRFITMVLVYLIGLGWWAVSFFRRFRTSHTS